MATVWFALILIVGIPLMIIEAISGAVHDRQKAKQEERLRRDEMAREEMRKQKANEAAAIEAKKVQAEARKAQAQARMIAKEQAVKQQDAEALKREYESLKRDYDLLMRQGKIPQKALVCEACGSKAFKDGRCQYCGTMIEQEPAKEQSTAQSQKELPKPVEEKKAAGHRRNPADYAIAFMMAAWAIGFLLMITRAFF